MYSRICSYGINLSLTQPMRLSLSAVSSSINLGTIIPGESMRKTSGSLLTLKPVTLLVVHTDAVYLVTFVFALADLVSFMT